MTLEGMVRAVPDRPSLSFGVLAPSEPTTIRRLEDLGIDSFWVGGHIASPRGTPEAMTGLARLVSSTQRATVGTAALVLPLYPPALVAKQFADLDVASGGRVVAGVGVGGDDPADFDAMQIPLHDRGARADEMVPLLRRLWAGDQVTHDGTYFRFRDVRVLPRPVQPGGPPIVVAGRRGAAVRRAALLGDGWMPYLYSPRRYRESVASVRACAGEAGRSLGRFAWMAWMILSIAGDPRQAEREADAYVPGGSRPEHAGLSARVAAAGDVEGVIGRLGEYVEAGARHFIFHCVPRDDPLEIPRCLLEDVIPEVRARFAARPASAISDHHDPEGESMHHVVSPACSTGAER